MAKGRSMSEVSVAGGPSGGARWARGEVGARGVGGGGVEPFVDVSRPRVLEDLCAVRGKSAGECGGVAGGVEVGLIVEAQGELDGERQVDVGGERCREAESDGSVVLGFELLPVVSDLGVRSEEHTSELQSLMRISYAVFCLKKKNKHNHS